MITVCYSGNRKIFSGLLLSVLSLVKHTARPLRVLVLSMEVPEQNPNFLCFTPAQIALLDRVLKARNPESSAALLDVTALYRELLADGKNAKTGYTPYTLLRLLLDLAEGVPDKLIYLDIDTMCTDDIGLLYDNDIEEYEFGAVRDHMGKVFIGRNYCNAGILLLNMKRIRETGLFVRARAKVCRRRMIMPDQSALNRLAERKLYLPRRFNEQRAVREDTVIKHFCKGIRFFPLFYIYNYKQWERDKVHEKLKCFDFDDLYDVYDELAAAEDFDS